MSSLLRHPIYLVLCATGLSYLFWANATGFSPFFFARTASSGSRIAGAHLMHK